MLAPMGALPAHLPLACRHSVLPTASAWSPPPRQESLGWERGKDGRGEDFWGSWVQSRGRHRLFVMPSSFSEG